MSALLFKPKTHPLANHLIFIPFFLDRGLLARLKRQALAVHGWLGAELIDCGTYALVAGFFGYPHLFAVTAAVADLPGKRVSFLGTAGRLQPGASQAEAYRVERIHGSGVFRSWAPRAFDLYGGAEIPFPAVTGVSVDTIQRETPRWLQAQLRQGIGIVEMEIFPLCWLLRQPVAAFVVTTDVVTTAGIVPFANRPRVVREFGRVLDWLTAET
jgi:hypothetical protein